jgi:hypothetical protein
MQRLLTPRVSLGTIIPALFLRHRPMRGAVGATGGTNDKEWYN